MTDDLEQGSASDASLNIERKLNLDLAKDRQELIVACAPLAHLRRLVEEHLDNYLKWFKASEWHFAYRGGMIAGPEPKGKHSRTSSSLERMLDLTAKLELLQEYPGFASLISGLDNPSQVAATIFEIEVDAWCSTRLHHTELTFSPSVTKRTAENTQISCGAPHWVTCTANANSSTCGSVQKRSVQQLSCPLQPK